MQICIHVILDPRFKLGFIKFRLQQGFREKSSMYFSKVEKTFQKLFDEYMLQFGDLTPENDSARSSIWIILGQIGEDNKICSKGEEQAIWTCIWKRRWFPWELILICCNIGRHSHPNIQFLHA
jgi:hypothetical protein